MHDIEFKFDDLFKLPEEISDNRPSKYLYTNCRSDVTGSWLYPPGGGQAWHVNTRLSPLRLYISWSETGDSGMLFLDNGTIKEDRDKQGWNIRIFDATHPHAVFAGCWRYSEGHEIIF
jgi:hypothetical protein